MKNRVENQWRLDDWASTCRRIHSLIVSAENQIKSPGSLDFALQLLESAEMNTQSMFQTLSEIGASGAPSLLSPTVLLPHLKETPARQHLLELLLQAQEAALEVDKERGWIGCGWSEELGILISRLEREK
jgi:hypothetical protein